MFVVTHESCRPSLSDRLCSACIITVQFSGALILMLLLLSSVVVLCDSGIITIIALTPSINTSVLATFHLWASSGTTATTSIVI